MNAVEASAAGHSDGPPSETSNDSFASSSFKGEVCCKTEAGSPRNSPTPSPEPNRVTTVLLQSSSGRDARNRAEKLRRDKLNGSINELSAMVPLVVASSSKIDKTGVLRHAAHELRKEHVYGKSMGRCHNKLVPRLVDTFLDLQEGILLTVTCRGIIVVISPNVEQYLGHCQTVLLGQNLLTITHPDDHELLKQQLMPRNVPGYPAHAPVNSVPAICSGSSEGPDGSNGSHAQDNEQSSQESPQLDRETLTQTFREQRRDFYIRLARAGPRSEAISYEQVRFDGSLRLADNASRFPPEPQQTRRNRRGEDTITPSGNDIVFVGMARVLRLPMMNDYIFEATKQEYRTRHLIDGRIVQCDQRISVVAGYMCKEVSGVSAFTFMHKEDVRWVMIALRQMYDLSRPCGESCYRLVSKSGQFIYLKTRGFLEIDKSTHAVESFVCVNTLVSESEGRELIREMKKKYSVIINKEPGDNSAMILPAPYEQATTAPAVEDPQQLEQAIKHLMSNLPNSAPCESLRNCSPAHVSDADAASEKFNRQTKSPSLIIIAPKSGSIKISIEKSADIINNLVDKKSPKCSIKACTSRPSVLRTVSYKKPHKNFNSPVLRSAGWIEDEPVWVKQEPVWVNQDPASPRLQRRSMSPRTRISNERSLNNQVLSPSPDVQNSNESYFFPTCDSSAMSNDRLKDLSDNTYSDNFASTTCNGKGKSLANILSETSEIINSHGYTDNGPTMVQSFETLHPTLMNINLCTVNQHTKLDSNGINTVTETYKKHKDVLKRTHGSEIIHALPKQRRSVLITEIKQDPLLSGESRFISETETQTLLCTDNNRLGDDSDTVLMEMEKEEEQELTPFIDQLTDPNSDLSEVVPRSLAALGRSIHSIGGAVAELTTYPMSPQTHKGLDEIMEEHRDQEQLFHRLQQDSLAPHREPRSPYHQTRV